MDAYDRIANAARKLEQHAEIILVSLFGSRATGKAREDSDIDVAILVAESEIVPSLFDFELELIAELADDRVDLVVLNHASPLLKHQVLKHGIKLFSRDKAAEVAFVVQAITHYLNTQYLRRVQDKVMHRQIQEGKYGRIRFARDILQVGERGFGILRAAPAAGG